LVLDVSQAVRDLESLCGDRADLRNGASDAHQRCSERREELHFADRVPAASGRHRGERVLRSDAALLHE
jgi:hypothetical protein